MLDGWLSTLGFDPEMRRTVKASSLSAMLEQLAHDESRERIAVGTRLPADVELRAVPNDWGPSVSRYRYVYSGDNVYFVEPSSREIVHVIE